MKDMDPSCTLLDYAGKMFGVTFRELQGENATRFAKFNCFSFAYCDLRAKRYNLPGGNDGNVGKFEGGMRTT